MKDTDDGFGLEGLVGDQHGGGCVEGVERSLQFGAGTGFLFVEDASDFLVGTSRGRRKRCGHETRESVG